MVSPAALGAGFIRSGNVYIKQSKLVSTAVGMVEAYQWYDGKAALDGFLSSIGDGYGGALFRNSSGDMIEKSRDEIMSDLPSFLEAADTVQVESFFSVQKLILQKAFEKIMGTGTTSERKNSKDKKVIGDLAWWIGKPAGSSEFVSQIGQAAPHLGAEEQKKLGMGENVTGLDVLKYLADPGFGELGEGGNRLSGIVLGFYNKLDLVSRYIDGKNSDRIESISGSIDPISATLNQFNPVTILATSIQNVRVASEVYGKDAGYMWEAQALGAFKGMANALGTAVAVATSWSVVGVAIGAAIIAAGNSIQVDTKTGKRDAVMNDRAAVGTAIGIASMYASYIAPPGAGASDRLLAATIRTGANSIGAGFSYNDDGNITGWTLSGSNGDAFWQNMGTGALSAGISEGVIKGFAIQDDYAKDIISSVSGAGVNTFAEYYKYDHGYQNNYAAMANPDIGNASAFWGLAVAMGSRAVSGGSSTDATSGDWSWDNAMQGFGEGFLGEFTGWVGLGSALANKTGQVYSMVSGLFGMARRREEELAELSASNGIEGGKIEAGWDPDGPSERELSAQKLLAEGKIIIDDEGFLRDAKTGYYVDEYGHESLAAGPGGTKIKAPVTPGGTVVFRKGDSLSKLASELRKAGVDVSTEDLQDYYGIDNEAAKKIAIGRKFVLPSADKTTLRLFLALASDGVDDPQRFAVMQELARYYNYEITKENGQIKIERRVAGYTPKDSQGREYFMVAAHPYFEDYLIKQPRMIDSTIPADSERESDRRMNELWGPGAGRFFGDVDMAKGQAFLEHTVGGFLSTLFPSHQDSARTEVQIQRENARQAALLEKMIRGKTDAEIFGTLEGAEHGALFGALMPLALGRAGGSGSASSNPIVQAIVQAYRAEKSAMKRGRIFEGLVRTLKSLPKGKLTDSMTDAGRAYRTVPDSDLGGIWEFKDVKNVGYTSQIQAQINHAKKTGQPYNLIVSELNKSIDPRIREAVKVSGGTIWRLNLITGRFEKL